MKMLHALGFTTAVTAAAHMGGSKSKSSQQSLTLSLSISVDGVFFQGVTTIVALTVLTVSTDTPENTQFLDSHAHCYTVVRFVFWSKKGEICVCVTWVTWKVSPLPCWDPSVSAAYSVESFSLLPVCRTNDRRTQHEQHSTICGVCHQSIN